MTVKFTNNASSSLASGINSTATSLTVADASTFPSLSGADDYCYLTIQQATATGREVVKATARSGNSFTIQRGVDNTTAASFSSGDTVELRLTSALLQDVIDQATVEGIKTNFQYVPTSGQTQFSGADSSGDTMIINDSELVNVYMNGVRLVQGSDYTVSSANNRITLTSGATTADIIDIEVFGNFTGQSGAAVAITGGAIAGTAITTGSINNTPIGATQANTVAATTLTANSVAVDNITIDGTEIDLSSGDLTIDVAGDITLDAGGANINFNDDGTAVGHIEMAGQNLEIKSKVADKDIILKGNDNGSPITALTLDMSEAGIATFNSGINIGNRGSASDPTLQSAIDPDTGIFWGGGDILGFSSGGSEAMRISGANLGIGGDPDKILHVKTSAINTAFVRIESTATNSYPTLSLKNDAREYQLTAHGGVNDSFVIYDGTAGANRLKIETNGNPTFQGNNHTNLQVKSGDDSVAAFLQTVQGSDARFGTSTNHPLNIATNGQFRIIVRADGHVLAGTTSTALNTSSSESGHNLFEHGYAVHSRDGQTVMSLNRLSNHGDIIDFRKDGSTVGSISTLNGMLAIGNDNVFLNIDGGSGDLIYPMSSASGGASDGVVTLGFNQRRFKDLHLSGVAYASQIQATNSSGSNGTTTAQYGVIALADGNAQATIGAHHSGDGYANLNLGSTVGGVRNMWHISKRLSSLDHRLEFFYYDANGFNSKFQMGTSGSFLAVDQISSNKGVHGTSVNNVDNGLVVRAGSGDTAASRGRFSNNAADVAIGRNIATFPGTWTKADNSVASAGWVFGTSGAAAFYQSNAGDTTPLADLRLLIDASGNVLAGTTDTTLFNNTTGGGIALMASNRLDVARVGDVVATFNRMSSDGSILQFYVRGVRCGDIHAIGTNGMAFAAPSNLGAALIVAGAANIVYPGQNNNGTVAVADNAIDLGATAVRFKDIYIGGSINHLDLGGNARVLYNKSSNLLGNGGTNVLGYQVQANFTMFAGTSSPRSDIRFTSGTAVSTKRWGFGGGITGTNDVFYIINEANVGQYMAHGSQTWTAHSDERIKENIVDVGTVLPSLMNMRCVKYNLISNPDDTKIGFIAQDWESSFPEVVDENDHLVLEDDGTIGTNDESDSTTPVKAMAYTETIPLLLKAIQELSEKVDQQAARIAELEGG